MQANNLKYHTSLSIQENSKNEPGKICLKMPTYVLQLNYEHPCMQTGICMHNMIQSFQILSARPFPTEQEINYGKKFLSAQKCYNLANSLSPRISEGLPIIS